MKYQGFRLEIRKTNSIQFRLKGRIFDPSGRQVHTVWGNCRPDCEALFQDAVDSGLLSQ